MSMEPKRIYVKTIVEGDWLILIGNPPEEDEYHLKHNCDDLGCSSVEHVIMRILLRPDQQELLYAIK